MISLKNIAFGFGILITGILGGVVIAPRKRHYSLYSPQNLARLAKGRKIRYQQQMQMSAAKKAVKREKLIERLKKL